MRRVPFGCAGWSASCCDVRMSITLVPERPDTSDAMALIGELQTHLESFYPPESRHGFSVQKLIEQQVAFYVLRVGGAPAGCGGIKLFADAAPPFGELKRMYVRPAFRGRGFGARLIDRLATHARERGIGLLRLETGIHQQAALRLYEHIGFRRIAPFPPYREDPLSRCYEMAWPPGPDGK